MSIGELSLLLICHMESRVVERYPSCSHQCMCQVGELLLLATSCSTQESRLHTLHGQHNKANPQWQKCRQVKPNFVSIEGLSPLLTYHVATWAGERCSLSSMPKADDRAGPEVVRVPLICCRREASSPDLGNTIELALKV